MNIYIQYLLTSAVEIKHLFDSKIFKKNYSKKLFKKIIQTKTFSRKKKLFHKKTKKTFSKKICWHISDTIEQS